MENFYRLWITKYLPIAQKFYLFWTGFMLTIAASGWLSHAV
ncbi:hypothetical protein [Pleurocapsa sp. CCALA 161]|nr:hypothetical protein [Pleurocapsa sp. CCALA 161]